jgi:hypothetical protein
LIGKQFGQAFVRMVADACEEVAQVSKGVKAESLRSRDETAEYGGGAPAVVATIKHPVFLATENFP